MKRHYNILLITGLLILLSACGDQTVKPSPVDQPTEQDPSALTVTESDKAAYREAISALHKNQLAKAETQFKTFIEHKPQLAGAYTNLGLVYYRQEKLEAAMQQVEKAISLNPYQAQAYNLRAQLLVKQGKIHEARDDYLRAIELKPDYQNAHYNIALLYDIYLQDIASALKHYESYMALLKQPDDKMKDWISHLRGSLNNG